LQWALGYSDNAADDMLIRLAGGAERIEETLRRKGISGIRVGSTEHELQCRIAGIEWRPEYIDRRTFEIARAAVAPGVRSVRVAQYLADPDDGATPLGMVDALAALHAGRLLSAGSTDYLLTIMGWSPTGPERLRGGLPPDWTIAHKTGTGPEWKGAVVGINDVGLLTAPDGHAYAVAVFIAQTRAALPERLALMQGVARAVVDAWVAGRATA
jgi:beta-lactamase class A